MKNRLKKKIALIVALMTMFVFGLNTNPLKPKAADVSVVISISASTVKVGDTVSVTVSVGSITGSPISGISIFEPTLISAPVRVTLVPLFPLTL